MGRVLVRRRAARSRGLAPSQLKIWSDLAGGSDRKNKCPKPELFVLGHDSSCERTQCPFAVRSFLLPVIRALHAILCYRKP